MPVFVAAKKELPWEKPDCSMPAQFYPFDQLHSSRGTMEADCTLN